MCGSRCSPACSSASWGGLGFIVHAPWLFPSLESTAYILAEKPCSTQARFYNVVMGHFLAIVVSFGVVNLMQMAGSRHLHQNLLWQTLSATVSLSVILLLMFVFRCTHPPAASTTLIIALGNFAPTLFNAFHFMMGVLAMAVVGEVFRHFRTREVSDF